MFYLLDGKAIPDNRHDVAIGLWTSLVLTRMNRYLMTIYFHPLLPERQWAYHFQATGSGDKMNDIVAKHFPSALSAK